MCFRKLVVISEDLESCDLSDSKTQHGRRGTRPPKSIKFLLEKNYILLEITFFGTYNHKHKQGEHRVGRDREVNTELGGKGSFSVFHFHFHSVTAVKKDLLYIAKEAR